MPKLVKLPGVQFCPQKGRFLGRRVLREFSALTANCPSVAIQKLFYGFKCHVTYIVNSKSRSPIEKFTSPKGVTLGCTLLHLTWPS